MDLPWSQACENNKRPILEVLQRHFRPRDETGTLPAGCLARALEIGSGTGQHATFLAQEMPWLYWQSSDVETNIRHLALRIEAAELDNLPLPLTLDALAGQWSIEPADYVFSANTLHIMSAEAVRGLFRHLPGALTEGGLLAVYGPFRYGGEYTSSSNASFDDWLHQRDPASGIRDAEWIDELATAAGLELLEDNSMPANNQLRVWRRIGSEIS